MPVAAERAARFAGSTCEHDPHCVGDGVANCRRQAPRVVLCRIFVERKTQVQGNYRCHRLVRMALDPATRRKPVTGLGRWHC